MAADRAQHPLIIVISGPGGVGKGAVVARLLQAEPNLWLSRSWTTRAQRPGEADDAYWFVTPEQFQERIDAGGFLEWVEFLDYRQGTPTPSPPAGSDIVFEIDVHGARTIKERYDDALLIFVDAPSAAEQERRLRGRGESDDVVKRRMEKSAEERRMAVDLGAHQVINDDLDQAVADVANLIHQAQDLRIPPVRPARPKWRT